MLIHDVGDLVCSLLEFKLVRRGNGIYYRDVPPIIRFGHSRRLLPRVTRQPLY
jgi:hypothetical protein